MLYSHEHDGAPLTAGDAKAFVAKRKDYDLFVNFLTPTEGGYLAGRTDAKGKFEDVALTMMEAAIIAELMHERKPVRAVALKCVRQGGIASPVRIIEKARGMLDVKTGARSWRAIRTITHVGGDDTTKEFFFDPPSGFRWAVLQAARGVGVRRESGDERASRKDEVGGGFGSVARSIHDAFGLAAAGSHSFMSRPCPGSNGPARAGTRAVRAPWAASSPRACPANELLPRQ